MYDSFYVLAISSTGEVRFSHSGCYLTRESAEAHAVEQNAWMDGFTALEEYKVLYRAYSASEVNALEAGGTRIRLR